MKHTVRLFPITVLAWLGACAPASDEVELALDDAPQHAALPAPAAETGLRTMGMSESRELDRAKPVVHVWKSASCGCCAGWVEHLKAAGYPVEVVDVADINAVKREHGVPVRAWACHTAQVDGYLIEGHVPASTIDRVLAEHPEVAGVAVPGMPMGTPGMEMPGMEPQPYQVMSFSAQGDLKLYEQH